MMEFKDRLRQLRKERGLRQSDIAEKLNVKTNTYNGYETGNRTPSLDTVKEIAVILDVDFNCLLDTKKDTDALVSEYMDLINLLNIKEIEIIKDFKTRGISLVDVVADLKTLADKYK
jgi:transcriptional regulator with XRE-family HTH domain